MICSSDRGSRRSAARTCTAATRYVEIIGGVDATVARAKEFRCGFLSPAGHMAWTGITAATLFAAAASGWQARRIAEFGIAFVVAVGLHGLWDSQNTLLGMAVVAIASLVVLGVAVHRSVNDLAERGTPVPIGVGAEVDGGCPGLAATGRSSHEHHQTPPSVSPLDPLRGPRQLGGTCVGVRTEGTFFTRS